MSGPSYTHHDLQELLGAFALDAVDDDERDVIEAHLAGCPRCRAEVEGHRETAALLAHSGDRAPDNVWDRIAAALDEAPPALDLARIAPRPPTAAESADRPDDLSQRREARAVPRSISLRVAAATMAVAGFEGLSGCLSAVNDGLIALDALGPGRRTALARCLRCGSIVCGLGTPDGPHRRGARSCVAHAPRRRRRGSAQPEVGAPCTP